MQQIQAQQINTILAQQVVTGYRIFKSSNPVFFIHLIEYTNPILFPLSEPSYLCTMIFSSRLIEEAVEAFARLPGIGRKTALRLVLHLLRASPEETHLLAGAITRMRDEIRFCKICFNVSDADVCSICSNPARRREIVCVVENIRDVMAIENTQQYTGVYHVLGGVISPLSGVGPEQLTVEPLLQRVASGQVQEVIMAISPTVEGDTTIFYLSQKLKAYPIKLTTIARGIAFGGELEYADEMTLARSLMNRLPLENYLSANAEDGSRLEGFSANEPSV